MINTSKPTQNRFKIALRKKYYLYIKRKELRKFFKETIKEKEVKYLIKDTAQFNEELIDVIMIEQPDTVRSVIELVNNYFDFEFYCYKIERKIYTLGKPIQTIGFHGSKTERKL